MIHCLFWIYSIWNKQFYPTAEGVSITELDVFFLPFISFLCWVISQHVVL